MITRLSVINRWTLWICCCVCTRKFTSHKISHYLFHSVSETWNITNCHSCCRFICKVFSNLALKWENNQNAASWQPVELSLLLQLDNVASKLRSLTQTHTDFKVLPTCQIRHLQPWSFYPRMSSVRDRLLPIWWAVISSGHPDVEGFARSVSGWPQCCTAKSLRSNPGWCFSVWRLHLPLTPVWVFLCCSGFFMVKTCLGLPWTAVLACFLLLKQEG